MGFCGSCGAQRRPGDRFCPGCGDQFDGPAPRLRPGGALRGSLGWIPYAFVLICFLLPFTEISCGGTRVSLSGTQLAFGSSAGNRNVPPCYSITIALAAAVFGLGLSGYTRRGQLAGVASVVGLGCFAYFKVQLDDEVLKSGMASMVSARLQPGFVLAGVGFLLGAILNGPWSLPQLGLFDDPYLDSRPNESKQSDLEAAWGRKEEGTPASEPGVRSGGYVRPSEWSRPE